MKDAIDHVLPWIRSEIAGQQLAEIVAREVREPVGVVTFKLKERGRYYGWNNFGPSEIDLVPPPNRRVQAVRGVAEHIAAKRAGLT